MKYPAKHLLQLELSEHSAQLCWHLLHLSPSEKYPSSHALHISLPSLSLITSNPLQLLFSLPNEYLQILSLAVHLIHFLLPSTSAKIY